MSSTTLSTGQRGLDVLTAGGAAARSRVRLRWLTAAAVVLLALSVTWQSLGDHALAGRSEGRYANVSLQMATSGNWLVPHYLDGSPHLTKPPLTYWLQAACIKVLGPTELAVRLPSAAANTLILLGLLALGWRMGGWRVGLIAMALLSITPLEAAVSRLALTDALHSLFWFGVLAGGYLAVRAQREGERHGRWVALLWTSFALGMLTKGLAWLPVIVLVAWLVLGRRWGEMKKLHLGWGLLLGCLPVAVWGLLVLRFDPHAAEVWYTETVSRAVGTGAHDKLDAYFLPVLLAGLFPMTAMMTLPGVNFSWREAWASLRKAEGVALWGLAVALPFVLFSINRGKLPSYLMPLAPPLALLTAMMLERWLGEGIEGPRGRGAKGQGRQGEEENRLAAERSGARVVEVQRLTSNVTEPASSLPPETLRSGVEDAGPSAIPNPLSAIAHRTSSVELGLTWRVVVTVAGLYAVDAAHWYIPSATLGWWIVATGIAVIAAMWIWWVLRGRPLGPMTKPRMPEVVLTPLLCTVAAMIGFVVVARAYGVREWWYVLPILLVVAANVWLCGVWTRRPQWRLHGLAAWWLAAVLCAFWFGHVEDVLQQQYGSPVLLARIEADTGIAHPRIMTFGFDDDALSFYTHEPTKRCEKWLEHGRAPADPQGRVVIISDARDWRRLERIQPTVADQYQRVFIWKALRHPARRWVMTRK